MGDIYNGVPLMALVMAIVEYIKQLGLSGAPLRAASLLAGLVIGLGYKAATAAPATFADWAGAAVYGLVLGLAASGVYDAGRSITERSIKAVYKDYQDNG